MQNQYSLQIVHPGFELLKRSARLLHFIAAVVIFINALHQLQLHNGNKILCFTQIIIATDIFMMVLFAGIILNEAPRLNLVFRFAETITLTGIAFTLILDGHHLFSIAHFIFAAGYLFLFYREKRVMHSEAIDIKPTGITIPNFLKDAEISWHEIKSIMPKYHSIIIETLRNKKIEFSLRSNLKIDELGQINDFCSKHLLNV